MLTYAEIVAAIPRLSAEDLDNLALAIKAARQFKSKDITTHHLPSIPDREASLVEYEIDAILQALLTAVPVPGFQHVAQLRRLASYPAFRKIAPALAAYFSSVTKDMMGRRIFMDMAWELLRKNIRSMGLPAGHSMMLKHAYRIPEVIEAAFPSYVESGFLTRVIDNLVHKKKKAIRR